MNKELSDTINPNSVDNTSMPLEKLELLKELSTLVHPSGRKKRTDIGKSHIKQSDKQMQQTKMAIYNRVRAKLAARNERLLSDNPNNNLLSKEFDVNGFYVSIPAIYETRAYNYQQLVDGRKINHTTHRVRTQKEVDLEAYRYEAWRELALSPSTKNQIVTPNADLRGILFHRYALTPEDANRIITNRALKWPELFEEIYFVRADEIQFWDYDTWRTHYDCIPVDTVLDEDFRFDYYNKPGSPNFHPEWAYYVEKQALSATLTADQEKQRKGEQFIANMKKNK